MITILRIFPDETKKALTKTRKRRYWLPARRVCAASGGLRQGRANGKKRSNDGNRDLVRSPGHVSCDVGYSGYEHWESFRAAQEPGAGRRATASDVGVERAGGVAPAENGEVVNPPLPFAPLPPQAGMAPAEKRQVISFPRALALVSGQNPQIAFANEQINEAFAQLTGARVLWLPSIQAGVNYQNHDGPLQNNDGTITAASRSALEAGLGMYAVGGGAPAIPGLSAKFAMADAVFQPRIAGQQVAARQHAATATTHDLLLFVAVAYLDLLRAFQQQAIAQETLDHAEQLARIDGGLRPHRARQPGRRRSCANGTRRAQECSWRRLPRRPRWLRPAWWNCSICRPNRVLVPEEPIIVPIELVSHHAEAAQLVADGLSHRPELAESRHLVAEAAGRLDRERYAPLLPNLLLDVSQSGYGGGPGSTIADFSGRFDFDATAYWQLRNFGLGEVAARESARSRLEQAKLIEVRLEGPSLSRDHRGACPIRIAARPDRRGRIGNPRGERVLPAEPGAHPRRSRLAAGSAPVAPSTGPEPPGIPAGSRRL